MFEPLALPTWPALPQTTLLQALAPLLWQDPTVQALWLEGSLARGNADRYSDVDLYISVTDAMLDQWRAIEPAQLFGAHYMAHIVSNFGAAFFVYHVYLTAGHIYDLHIQPLSRELPAAQRLILACRTDDYLATIQAATVLSQGEEPATTKAVDPQELVSLLAGYWIAADKSRKVLYRKQDSTTHVGLYIFRQMLARLLFIETTGKDCGDLTRTTIHGLKVVAPVLKARWDEGVGEWLGSSATTHAELFATQAQLNEAVARVGRVLAERFGFTYPAALEATVRQNWQTFITEEMGMATA